VKKLRIVFMGTPDFAVASLDAILRSRHDVLGVVTVADKPAGRGLQLHQSPVKQFALQHNIPCLQPLKLRDPEFIKNLESLNADIFVVVAFRMLPEMVWSMPPLGSINLHGSLLPKYRGAAPINWAVMQGEKETGVTTFFLQHEIDTGQVIRRTIIRIGENETAGELHDRMMVIGAQTLVDSLNDIADGKIAIVDQQQLIESGEELLHAPKIFKEDCCINWSRNTGEVHNFIRGLSPYPTAWTMLGDKTLKIFNGAMSLEKVNGEFETDGKTYLRFRTADGSYETTDLQLEGKKRMGIEEFLRGWRP
jgi:methionyl-tRNA formyltransferase